MDGPRSRGYGARRGYDVRTRCIRGCTERRQGVSPGRISHETETARFRVGRVAGSAQQFKATRSAPASAGAAATGLTSGRHWLNLYFEESSKFVAHGIRPARRLENLATPG